MLLVQQSDESWLGNLINWVIFEFIGYIAAFFGFLFVLIGQNTWFYDTMIGLELLPSEVTAYSKTFDA